MSKNVVEFPGSQEESNEPTYHVYEIVVINPDGSTSVVKAEGYLVITPTFVGVCQGPYNKSEFVFMSFANQVSYVNSLGPVKFTGKLSS